MFSMLLWVSLQSRCYCKVRLHFNSHTRAAAVLFYQRQKKNFCFYKFLNMALLRSLAMRAHWHTIIYQRRCSAALRCCKLAHKVIFFIHLVFFCIYFCFHFRFLICFVSLHRFVLKDDEYFLHITFAFFVIVQGTAWVSVGCELCCAAYSLLLAFSVL